MEKLDIIEKLKPQKTSDHIFMDAIEQATLQLLQAVGEDPTREGLQKTPNRVSRMYSELLKGYYVDPESLINGAVFDGAYDEMVLIRNIDFHSLCEHHLLPFIGRAHVAYVPNGKIIGLSKIPRIVDMFSSRLQVQERLTHQIGEFLLNVLQPQGVAVVVEGLHLCATMRGIKKHGVSMTTSSMNGVFRTDPILRREFLDHLARGSTTINE